MRRKDLQTIWRAFSKHGAETDIRKSKDSILIAIFHIIEFIDEYNRNYIYKTKCKVDSVTLIQFVTLEHLKIRIIFSNSSKFYYLIVRNCIIRVSEDNLYQKIEKIYDTLKKEN